MKRKDYNKLPQPDENAKNPFLTDDGELKQGISENGWRVNALKQAKGNGSKVYIAASILEHYGDILFIHDDHVIITEQNMTCTQDWITHISIDAITSIREERERDT